MGYNEQWERNIFLFNNVMYSQQTIRHNSDVCVHGDYKLQVKTELELAALKRRPHICCQQKVS
jgi:hypothetical protein